MICFYDHLLPISSVEQIEAVSGNVFIGIALRLNVGSQKIFY